MFFMQRKPLIKPSVRCNRIRCKRDPVHLIIIPESATWMHLSLSFPTDTVYVRFGLGLIQILNVDEKAQVIKLKVWERHVSLVRCSSFFLKKKMEDISPFHGATVCFFIRKIEKVFIWCPLHEILALPLGF